MTLDELCKGTVSFESVENDCGIWVIPIDDLDGELCPHEKAARMVTVIEYDPIKVAYDRLRKALEKCKEQRDAWLEGCARDHEASTIHDEAEIQAILTATEGEA